MQRVRIAELADDEGVVRDRTIEDCEIVGPAVLVSLGTENRLEDCEFAHTLESLAQVHVGGGPVVLLAACTLTRCRFAMDVDTTQLHARRS